MKIEATTLKQIVREVREELGDVSMLTPNIIGSMLNFSPETVRNWCKSKELKASKFGRSWRIEIEDFNLFRKVRKI
jgi:excisionase family DNA binding protein